MSKGNPVHELQTRKEEHCEMQQVQENEDADGINKRGKVIVPEQRIGWGRILGVSEQK